MRSTQAVPVRNRVINLSGKAVFRQNPNAGMQSKGGCSLSRKKTGRRREALNNRAALMAITGVVFSLAVAVEVKGTQLRAIERDLLAQEQTLTMQLNDEKNRAQDLEEERVYVQTKEYIEKVAKEKLGLVNPGETLLKPSEKK
ncbi:MAG: septum formation initiator family protein [Bacillota bacterium]|nr:septum formation initiator family protein [Bacillota bacterium]